MDESAAITSDIPAAADPAVDGSVTGDTGADAGPDAPSASDDNQPVWRTVGRSAILRALVLPVSAILGIIITRVIIGNYGPGAFAQYGLLVGIGAMLPFTDLGISAAVVNALAAAPSDAKQEHVYRTLVAAIRVLVASAVVLLALTIALSVTGAWPTLLGAGLDPKHGSLAAGLCLGLIAVAVPVGIGQRALVGLGKNHVSIILQGLQSPMVLAVLLLAIWVGIDAGPYVAAVAYGATFILAIVSTVIVARMLPGNFGRATRDAPRIRAVRGEKVFDQAWPMLVQLVAMPIALQTDRLIISHVNTVSDLASYNLASQMFTPVAQVASAAAYALWPMFVRARTSDGPPPVSPQKTAWQFGGAATAMCLLICLVSGWLANLASGGKISLSLSLVVVFSVLMILQAAKNPLGMYMTDAAGLRFQAYMVMLMLPVNLVISWVLAKPWGPAGPVMGSIVGVLLFQVLANAIYVRRDLRRRFA